jgi:haloalkane dehalogenase
MVEPGMEGVAESEAAFRFWRDEWSGQSFMAIGAKALDAETTYALRSQIRGCPEPLVVTEADHFVPEWGEPVVQAALRSFGDLWQGMEHTI